VFPPPVMILSALQTSTIADVPPFRDPFLGRSSRYTTGLFSAGGTRHSAVEEGLEKISASVPRAVRLEKIPFEAAPFLLLRSRRPSTVRRSDACDRRSERRPCSSFDFFNGLTVVFRFPRKERTPLNSPLSTPASGLSYGEFRRAASFPFFEEGRYSLV